MLTHILNICCYVCEEKIMKKDILKKFDRKKQLMVSPFALAISACGGGGTSEVNDDTSSSEVSEDKSPSSCEHRWHNDFI